MNGDEIAELCTFDYYGRTTSCTDLATGAATDLGYTSPAAANGSANKLSSVSSKGETLRNLLVNGGFERTGAGWAGLTRCNDPYLGAHSANLGSGTMTQTVTGLEEGALYTFSLYLKGGGIVDLGDMTTAQTRLVVNPSDGEWHRQYVTFRASSTANLRIYCSAGYVKVDEAHLEKVAADGSGNLLENTDFTHSGSLDRWTRTGFDSSDGLQNGTVRITAGPTLVKKLYQDVAIGRPAEGTGFVLSAKASGYTLPERDGNSGRVFSLGLILFYTDGTEETFSEHFNYDTGGLQFKSMAVRPGEENLGKTIEKVRYVIEFSHTRGQMLISDPLLQLDETGVCYSYDADGNLVSSSVLRERNESYSYTNANELLSASRIGGDLSERYSYTYDPSKPHRLTSARSEQTGLGLTFTYDSKGNLTGTRMGAVTEEGEPDSSSLYITAGRSYSANQNYLASETDQRGQSVFYTVDPVSGLLTAVRDARNNQTSFTYDSTTRQLTAVSAGGMSVSYSYGEDDLCLASVTHNGFSYGFCYDAFGNLASVTAGGRTLVTNSFLPGNGSLEAVTYGNGDETVYTYDRLGRVETETRGTDVYTYRYNARGMLGAVLKNDVLSEEYYYDLTDRLIGYKAGQLTLSYAYDEASRLSVIEYRWGSNNPLRYLLTYGPDERVESVSLVGGAELCYTYDTLSRVSAKEFQRGDDAVARTEYGYLNLAGNRTTTLVSNLTNRGGNGSVLSEFEYTYDANGNIASVTEDSGAAQTTYTYDSLNRLAQSDADRNGQATRCTYSYDAGGNLVSRNYYTFDDFGPVLEQTDTYTYASSGWKDLLVACNGEPITYDAIGNPLSYYGGRSFTWEGRELQTFTNGASTASYVYNENGIRTQKTVNGVTTSFLVDGSTIRFSLSNDLRLSFPYYGDELVGFKSGNDTYYYLKNLQGDIVQIVDGDGNVVVEYEYDDWGKVLSVSGSLAGTVGVQNPFRYRGYYYDEESGLYYLNSRYYDPETGRFISADSIAYLGPDGLSLSFNLFVYCGNNPIMGYDPEGNWNWGGFLVGCGIVAATVISIATFGVGTGVGAIVAAAAISTGATMAAAAAADSAFVVDITVTAPAVDYSASGGFSLVVDYGTGTVELYPHVGISKGNSRGVTYSVGIISNYSGESSYQGPFIQGGISCCGIGINHCFDDEAPKHTEAVQATLMTFGSPKQAIGYGCGLDIYLKPIVLK